MRGVTGASDLNHNGGKVQDTRPTGVSRAGKVQGPKKFRNKEFKEDSSLKD